MQKILFSRFLCVTVLAAVSLLFSIAASSQVWTFRNGFGQNDAGTGFPDIGRAVCTDAAGNIYVTGKISDATVGNTVSFGGAALASAGDDDGFVAKFNSSGVHQWSLRFGGTLLDEGGYGIATDGTSVYVVGETNGTMTVGLSATTYPVVGGGIDGFVMKLDAATGATVAWVTRFGGANSDRAQAVCLDPVGNVYISGYFRTRTANPTATFGSFSATVQGNTTSYTTDLFAAALNSSGTFLWASTGGSAGGNDNIIGSGIAYVPSLSEVIVTGCYRSLTTTPGSVTATYSTTVPVSSVILTNASVTTNEDFCLLEIAAATGAFVSGSGVGAGDGNEAGLGITYDSNTGDVFFAGYFGSTSVSFPGNPAITNGSATRDNIMYGRYNPSTNAYTWVKDADNGTSATAADVARAITADGPGTVFISGNFRNTITFPGGSSAVASGVQSDVFVAKINTANGNAVYATQGVGTSATADDISNGIATAPGNNVWITGQYASSITFPSLAALASLGGTEDILLAKFNDPPINVIVSGALVGNGNYSDLTSAFTAINGGAQTGATILVSIVGNTTETVPAVLNQSTGPWATLTISPSGGAARTISGAIAGGSPLIDFNGADNVTVDGLNSAGNSLTIENTTVSTLTGTSTIRFIGGATSNTITRCSLKGAVSSSVATNGAIIFFSTDAVTANGNDNNTISNCDIGPSGANLPTKAILGNGSTTTTAIGNSGIVITNNDIHDFFGAAVTSSGIATNGGCNTWTITNNRFYQTGTRTWTTGATHRAIDIGPVTATSGAQGFTITGNIVGYSSNTQTGTYTLTGSTGKFQGITFNGITGGTVSNINSNTVASVSLTGVTSSGTSTSSPFAGMIVINGLANTNSNIIGSQSATGSLTFSTNSTTSTDVYGIFNFSLDDWTSNTNNVGGISVTNAAASGTYILYGMRANTSTTKVWNAASNNVGGTIANSIQLNATGVASQVVGMQTPNAISTFTLNNIRNLTTNIGTGTITSASVAGIIITTATPSHTVSQNTIFNLTNTNATVASVVTGIQFTGGTANIVQRNLIYNLTVATTSATAEVNGIRVGGGTTIYRNNMIALGANITTAIDGAATNSSTTGINGINEALGTNSFFHNSVYIGGSPTAGIGASYAFNGTQTAVIRSFRDNIFFNARSNAGATGKNYAIKINGTTPNPANLTINNNVYFANGTGGVFGFFNSLDVPNLAAWKIAVGQDAGSFESNPQYNDPTNAIPDLHLHPTNATVAEGNGVDVGVTDDYDGQTRASLTPVDIGADAGNYTGIDLAAPAITYTALSFTCSTTDRIFTATITDVSGVPADGSGTEPRVYFKKNAGPYFSTDGNLTSGTVTNGVWTFTISEATMGGIAPGDVISYYVVAQDVLGNISSNPSGVASGTVLSHTAPGSPNTYSINNPLSGTYNVGAGEPVPFNTLTSAVNAYNTACITGAVVFNLVDANYSAGETFPITINANPFASAVNTLTIKPNTAGTLITGSVNGALIKLNDADYVTIDGSSSGASAAACLVGGDASIRDLTIQNTNTGTSSVVIAVQSGTNGAQNNTIKNVNVLGQDPTTTLLGISLGGNTPGTAGTDNDNNRVENCSVKRAIFGIYSAGASLANQNANTVITQNDLSALTTDRIRRVGIVIFNENNTQISYNSVAVETNESADAIGIGVGTQAVDVTNVAGDGVTNARVFNNKINGVASLSTVGFSAAGIAVATATGGANVIRNNMITGVTAPATSPDIVAGIYIVGAVGSDTRVYNNSVSMTGDRGAVASQTPSYGIAITGTDPTVELKNNIFYTTQISSGGGVNAKSYAIGMVTTTFVNLNSNNNMFWSAGANDGGFRSGSLTTAAGTDYATLALWQAAVADDANSVETLPPFVNDLNNLHITADNNQGTPIATVTDDYDCQSRDASIPDIGADEIPNCAAIGGTASGSATFCGSGTPTITASGYTASGVTYQWYSSTVLADYPNGGTAISGETNPALLNAGVVSTTTYFWLRVSCPGNTSVANSTLVTVSINNVTAGSVDNAQTICSGGDPAALTEVTPGTGSGVVTYQWQSGTGTCATATFADIGGANSATFDPGVLTVTTSYRRITTSTLNGVPCSATSNCVTITVNDVTAGSVDNAQTICSGGDPAALTEVTPGTGSGLVTYQWQSGTGTCATATFADIGGATSATFDPGVLTVTTSYRRITTSTLNGVPCSATSNCVTITVNDVTAGSVDNAQTICSGGDPAALTEVTAGTGSGVVTYLWQSGTGTCATATFADIGGATSAIFDPGVLTVTTSYRRVATSTLNGVPCSATSNCVTITVNPTPTVNTVANQAVCNNTATALVNFTGAVFNSTAYTVSSFTNKLYTIPTSTYQATTEVTATMAGFTVTGMNAISYDPTSSQYYVIVKVGFGVTQRHLGIINTTTGVITNLGSLGDKFSYLNFAPNGRLWGVTGNGATVPEALYTINKNTAASTFIRNLGNGADGEIICFNPADANLYHWSGNGTVVYEKMDTTTYTITAIGTYSSPIGNGEVFGASVDPVSGDFVINDISANVEKWNSSGPVSSLGVTKNITGGFISVRGLAFIGTVFNWTNNNTSIGLAASGTGNIASFTATNVNNTPSVATITVTPSYSNGGVTCTGTPTTFTITVNPKPILRQTYNGVQVTANNDGVDDAGAFSVCNSTSDNVFLTEIADIFNIAPSNKIKVEQQIIKTNVNINTAADGVYALSAIGPIPLGRTATLINSALSGTVVIKRRAFFDDNLNNILDANECVGDWIVYTITVNTLPDAPIVTSPVTYCVGDEAVPLFATGTNLLWYMVATGGTGSATAPTPSTATAGTTSYWVSQTNANNCEGPRAQIDVVVNELPVVTCPANSSVCISAPAFTLTGGSPAGGTYSGPGVSSGMFNPTAAGPGVKTITYSYTNANNCLASCTFTITVNPLPVIDVASNGPTEFCQGGSVGLFALTQNYLKVLVPQALTMPISTAVFGAPISTTPVNGNFVYIPDGTASYLGCNPYTAGSLTGKVALIDRGICNFTVKVKNAQNAGAIGVIIVNNVAVPALVTMGGTDPTITIPVIMVSQANGLILKNLISLGLVNGMSLSPYTYLWSTGATTQNITVNTSGNYFVTVTDANGCSSVSDPVPVRVLPLPTPTITASGPLVFCNGNSVTLTATGGQGNALTFDGINDYVQGSNANLPVGNAPRTIEAWINPHVLQNGTIFNWGSYSTNQRSGLLYIGGKIYFVGENNDLQGGTTLPLNTWSHLAVTFNGSQMILYVNGIVDGSAVKTLNTVGTNYRIGVGMPSPTYELFNGDVDEVRVWNFAMPQTQIMANKNITVPVNSSGLVAYYKLDEGSGPITTDATINSNVGTLLNGTSWLVPSTAPVSDYVTYLWAPGGQTTQSINVTASGSYSVTVTNGNGCTATSAVTAVIVNPVPNAVATPSSQTICTGNTITPIVLSGSVAGTVYNWIRNNLTVTGIAASGTGNISGSLTNTTAAPVTVTFTITPTYTNAGVTCTGTPIVATVIVNPVYNFTCPGNMTQTIIGAGCVKAVNTLNPVFCGVLTKLTWKLTGATVLNSPSSGINYVGLRNMNVGITTVIYTATAAGGITRTCSFTVTVLETIPPDILCPLDKHVNTDPGVCYKTGPISLGTPTANDNCGIASITNNAPAIYQHGVNFVTWTVTDKSGNTRTCIQRVTVDDVEKPTITCPPNVNVNTGPVCTATPVTVPQPVIKDNCGGIASLTWVMIGVTYGGSPLTGINYVPTMNYATGLSKITYTVVDLSGNVQSCSFNVVVTDVTPPTLTCPPAQTLCKVAGDNYNIPLLIQSDNCVIASTSFRITGATNRTNSGTNASGIFNVGVSTIKWTVKDVAGNTSTCTTIVTILPENDPDCIPITDDPVSLKYTEAPSVVPVLSITAWPNPSDNYFNLKIKSPVKETVEIKMFDMAGKLVQQNRGAPDATYRMGDNVVNGMYIIEVRQAGKSARTKVVKQ